ncbi:MAG: twin-arginine translocase subunit TatC [Candidatus Riflebacteria bacterium]|nr:twin-arginine translocase subunit TatC [Candidatus Riflebacteria bacterium]
MPTPLPAAGPGNGEPEGGPESSLVDHLAELRTRILICLASFLAWFAVAWWQSDVLVRLALGPLRQAFPTARLAALTVTEAFVTTLKLSALAALTATLPVIVWQAWRFVAPGLLPRERFWSRLVLVPAMLCFAIGVAFCYLVALPAALGFLIQSGDFLVLTLSYAAFVEFEMMFLVVMGVLFELPLLLVFLDVTGLFPAERVRENRRVAIVAAFVVGGILSPPDVVSQFLVSVPLVLLTEAGLWLSLAARRFRGQPGAGPNK